MIEYRILYNEKGEEIEDRMNRLAKDGWTFREWIAENDDNYAIVIMERPVRHATQLTTNPIEAIQL